MLLAIAGVFVFVQFANGLEMRGDKEMSVEVGEKFKDPGVKSPFASVTGEVDTDKVGDYKITYELGGDKVTRTVHVVDPKQFVIGLKGSAVQKVREGDPYIDGGAFATNRKKGPVTDIKASGEVDTSKPGLYKIKYTAVTDGITLTTTRNVEVVPKSEFGKTASSVPVLMYHWIYSDKNKPDSIDGNWIKDKDLEKHLEYLKSEGYYYPSWKELSAWIDGKIELPEKSIILTFDDGKKDFFENGIPLFEKYKIPVTSFMICWEHNYAKSKLREYASEYIDFESHTYDMHQGGTVEGHRGIIANMSKDEIAKDLARAAKKVGSNDAMAYPYGDYTDAAKEAVKEQKILCSFTTEYGQVKKGMDKTILPRVRVFGDSNFDTWKASIK